MVSNKLEIKFSAISRKAKPRINPTTPVPLITATAKPVKPAINKNKYTPSNIITKLIERCATDLISGVSEEKENGLSSNRDSGPAAIINSAIINKPTPRPGKRYKKPCHKSNSTDWASVKFSTPEEGATVSAANKARGNMFASAKCDRSKLKNAVRELMMLTFAP